MRERERKREENEGSPDYVAARYFTSLPVTNLLRAGYEMPFGRGETRADEKSGSH